MLVAGFSIGPGTDPAVRRLAWRTLLVLVGAAAGSAVWFTIVQKWVIGAFCPYCLATHVTGLLLAALVIWLAPSQLDEDSSSAARANPVVADCGSGLSAAPDTQAARVSAAPAGYVSAPRRVIGRWPAVGLALAGLALAGVLAACQVGFTPPAVYRAGESSLNLPGLDPQAMPLLGSPGARYVVTLLFDYKCPHCQQIHFVLEEAIRRYRGELAFALCPAPLSRQCNPYIPRDVDEFKDSCELAKVGLAVWVARREAFPAFDRWMFSFESGDGWQPRSLEAARAKATELVGPAKFAAARADPWIGRYMENSIRVYGETGSTAIPKLVFGSRWVIPQVYNADDLVSILHDSLALPRP
jgi:protein-disulfide isomerase